MAKVGILSSFIDVIAALRKGGVSEMPNEEKFSKEDKAKLEDVRNSDNTKEIERSLSSKSEELHELQFNVNERTANQVAQRKARHGKEQNQGLGIGR